jgi:uncharacterized membrane protein
MHANAHSRRISESCRCEEGRRTNRTHGRLGILLFVSLFERQVVILAEPGFDGRIGAPDWNALTQRITLLVRHGNCVARR